MPSLTPTDERTKQQTAELFLSVFKPTTILSALVNDGTITKGARTIAYDTGTGSAANFALITNGMPLFIGRERVRVKSISGNEVSGTIIVAENSIDWGNNDAITIEFDHPLFPILPSFSTTGIVSTFRKDIGTTATGELYTDENEQPPPVVVVGSHLFVDWYQGVNITWDFDLSDNSYVVTNGAAISSYNAIVSPAASGLTVSINTSTGAGTLTATQTGQWWVAFSVTDDNGKTQTSYRAVMTDAPITSLQPSSVGYDWNNGGGNFSVPISDESIALSDVPDRALCVLWIKQEFDGTESYTNIWATGSLYNGENIIIAGYNRRDNDNDNLEIGTGKPVFTIDTPEQQLASRDPFGSISLKAQVTVTDWFEYSTWLTIGRAIHHILKWHSTAFEMLDIAGLMRNTDGVKFLTSSENNLLQRGNNLAFNNGIKAKLVCNRVGQIWFERDTQLQNDATRGALSTVFTFDEQDMGGAISTVREPEIRTLQTSMDGFSFDGTTSNAFLALAPGDAPEPEGIGKTKQSGQVISNQTDLNERAGRLHGVANANLVELRSTFHANYMGVLDITPELGFYVNGFANSVFRRGLSLNGLKLICRNITYNFVYKNNAFTGIIQTLAIFEFEVTGISDAQTDTYPGTTAIQCPPGVGSNSPSSDPTASDDTNDDILLPPTAILAFSSTEYRLFTDTSWTTLDATAVNHGTADKFWYIKAQSYDPKNLIFWLAQSGAVSRVVGTDGTGSLEDVSPSGNPPNTWSDAPAPTVGTSEFIQVESDAFNEDHFYVLLTFQDGASNWRGWLAKRTTGTTYSYLALYDQISLPDQSKPIFMSIGVDHIVVTCWQDLATDKLKALVFTKSPFAFDSEFDIVDASLANIDAFTKWAIPVLTTDYSATPFDDTAPLHLFGRIPNPNLAGLGAGDFYALKYNGSWSNLDIFDIDGEDLDIGDNHIRLAWVGENDPAGREYFAVIQTVP